MKFKKPNCNGTKKHNGSAAKADSDPSSSSSNGRKKVTLEEIEYVQNLIERCLVLYMTKDEATAMLVDLAKIDQNFIHLVWQQLEKENPEFFKAYAIRLELKKQIITFNQLLEQQYILMKDQQHHYAMQQSLNYGHTSMPVNSSNGIPADQHYSSFRGGTNMDPPCNGSINHHMVNGIPIESNFYSSLQNGGGTNTNQWCNGSINHMVNVIPLGSNFYSGLQNGNAASFGQQEMAGDFDIPPSPEMNAFLNQSIQPNNCSAEGSHLNTTNYLTNWEDPLNPDSSSPETQMQTDYENPKTDSLNGDSSSPENQMQIDKENPKTGG